MVLPAVLTTILIPSLFLKKGMALVKNECISKVTFIEEK
jgi:hypothetical protein